MVAETKRNNILMHVKKRYAVYGVYATEDSIFAPSYLPTTRRFDEKMGRRRCACTCSDNSDNKQKCIN